MRISTGQGTISLSAVVAIWSLSLAVNLPGLAVTPMLEDLQSIFPGTSELEIDLLSELPNLLIIPFVLLSGKLSMSRHKVTLVVIALSIYLAAGALYFVCHSMGALIWVSCMLGVGCGLLIPFSTGLVADVFVGKYRMSQMGIISAIGNLALVVATFAVGVLAPINWHMPFLVYLIPLVPLLMTPWLRKLPATDLADDTAADIDDTINTVKGDRTVGGFFIKRITGLVVSYFFFMCVTAIILYYLPFMMASHGMPTVDVGTVTSVLFVGMMVGGFALTPVLKTLKSWTYLAGAALLAVGCALMSVTHSLTVLIVGAVVIGLAIGTLQPIIFDKAPETVTSPKKATLALAIVMSANYLAMSIAPEIVDLFRVIFHAESPTFPFVLDLVMTIGVVVLIYLRRSDFTFAINSDNF